MSTEHVDELCGWLGTRVLQDNELWGGAGGRSFEDQQHRKGALIIQPDILRATAVEEVGFDSSQKKIFGAIAKLVRTDPPMLRAVGMEIPVSWQAVVFASDALPHTLTKLQ